MPEAIGEITILHGEAVAEGPSGARELAVGSPIYNDDVITTEGKSAVEILFNDGAILSQGPNSKVHLDDYVFDPDQDAGEMTMELLEGTFRSVTGEIVDMNPEGFRIDTPSTTIGIRGTTVGADITPGAPEQVVLLDFVDRPVVVQSHSGGQARVMSQDGEGLSATPDSLSGVGRAPAHVLSNLQQLSSRALEQGVPIYRDAEGKTEAQKEAEREQAEADEAQAAAEEAAEDAAQAEAEAQAAADAEAEAQAAADAAAQAAAEAEAAAQAAAAQAAELAAQAAADTAAAEAAAQAAAEAAAAEAAAKAAQAEAAAQAAAAQAAAEAAAQAQAAAQAAAAARAEAEAIAAREAQEAAAARAEFEAEQQELSTRDFGADGGQDEEDDGDDTGDDGAEPNDDPDDDAQEGGGEDVVQNFGADSESGDGAAEGMDGIIEGGDDGTTPPPPAAATGGDEGEEDDTTDDDPVVVDNSTLSLASYSSALTVNLSESPSYYETTDDSTTRSSIDSAVVNVIGSSTQANTMTGDDNANQFTGGDASDTMYGGLGDDTFFASANGDDYYGEGGNDMISYLSFTEGVSVNLGSEQAQYPVGNPTITDKLYTIENVDGSNEADTIWGSSDSNALYGNDGDDLIWGGGGGTDSLYGGAGNDRFKFHDASSLSNVVVDGGDDTDVIEIWGTGTNDLTGLASVTGIEGFYFKDNGASVTVETGDFTDFGPDNSDPYIAVNSANTTTETINIIISENGGDISLEDTTFTNWEAGYDVINITGSTGNDSIGGSVYNDNITAGKGNDEIESNGGNDSLDGGDDNDKFDMSTGFDGNDTVVGGTGDDSLTTGSFSGSFTNVSGIESLEFTTSMNVSSVTDNLIESGKTLVVDYSSATGSLFFNGANETDGIKFIAAAGNDSLWGGSGNDTFEMALGAGDIIGNAGDDLFKMGSDVVYGDIIDGGVGNDSLYITDNASNDNDMGFVKNMEYIKFQGSGSVYETVQGNDMVSSGATLIIDATAASSMIFDGSAETDGAFQITGSYGDDNITGGSGNDFINAKCGVNVVDGGAGNDTFAFTGDVQGGSSFDGGASGIDRFLIQSDTSFEASNTQTSIEELELAANTKATLDFGMDTFLNGLTSLFGDSGDAGSDTLLITDSGGVNSLDLSSASLSSYSSWNSTNDTVIIEGGSGDDVISSWNAAVKIDGGDGNDQLTGGDGNDTLLGGAGTDLLKGDDGNDVLTGGTGNDTFHMDFPSEAKDTITDFNTTTESDKLQFMAADFLYESGGQTLDQYSDRYTVITDDAEAATYMSTGTCASLTTTEEQFVYVNTSTIHEFYYDSNGVSSGGEDALYTIENGEDIDATDIYMS
ncbi:FecR domain-containing protein [Pseudodesulfovibrio sp. zrk46]|uniref:FecR domain-containing protein n=1 Tax=Pseudodesulfovibrio sp. zrk46 TaxID=2725288 RepID=UPI001449E17B|nr:FecR domain-containing protein [Pseudodesulfovibrio sp. zrk46]QJB56189.1 hypothetical protein HFN16_07085 [Pseudodesulfovibrio sp. zrk46]